MLVAHLDHRDLDCCCRRYSPDSAAIDFTALFYKCSKWTARLTARMGLIFVVGFRLHFSTVMQMLVLQLLVVMIMM